MIPLSVCSSGGCPGIYLAGDHIVVQGELLPLVDTVAQPPEARVRIPADVFYQAAWQQMLAVEVVIDGTTHTVEPDKVNIIRRG